MDMEIVKAVGSVLLDAAGNRKVQRVVLGTYTDGSTRNLFDAASGEFLSPKDREKYLMGKKKSKKKKHKKKKKVKLDWD